MCGLDGAFDVAAVLGSGFGSSPMDVTDRRVRHGVEAFAGPGHGEGRVSTADELVRMPCLVMPLGRVLHCGAEVGVELIEQQTLAFYNTG